MLRILIISLLSIGVCQAENRLYSSSLNLPAGSSTQLANLTLYSNAVNLPLGSKVDLGTISVYADAYNLPTGASVISGPSVFGYDNQPYWETKRSSYEPF